MNAAIVILVIVVPTTVELRAHVLGRSGNADATADHRMASAPGGMVESTGESPWVQRSVPAGDDDNDRGEVVTNALDFYGTWKLFDGLADAVFRGVNRAYALGATPQQRYMGEWSGRMPVRELMIGLP